MLTNVIADPTLRELAEFVLYSLAAMGAYVVLMGGLWLCRQVWP